MNLRLLFASAGASALAALVVPAAEARTRVPLDFALGQNAEDQACRAQTRFTSQGDERTVDIYCGEWERPSGWVTVAPATQAEKVLAKLQEQCVGEEKALTGSGVSDLRQIACRHGDEPGSRRFGLRATRGGDVAIGTAYPADWGPMVRAALVQLGVEAPAAAAQAGGETLGLREIASVYPEGPPGQGAALKYEVLRRRAYEKNASWSFAGSERDFSELLRAHRAVSPEDVKGEAEILSEIGLNLSDARRFDEAEDSFRLAETRAKQAGDRLLETKLMNYRAIDRMNRRRYREALDLALQANAARQAVMGAGREGGYRIAASDITAGQGRSRSRAARALLVSMGDVDDAEKAAILSAQGSYVAGTAARALGRLDEAAGHMNDAQRRLGATRVPPAWMIALVAGERARLSLARGDAGGAQDAANQGLATIRASAPATRAEGHLLLTLARVQRESGRGAEALATGRKAVEIFARQRETPGMPPDVAAGHLDAVFDAWTATPDATLANEYFETLALVWDGAAARSAAQLAARLASREAAGEARAYQDAERAYRAALARRQRLESLPDVTPEQVAEADAAVVKATETYEVAETALRAKSPRFLELSSPKVAATDLTSVLREKEGYLRIVLAGTEGYAALVTGEGVKPYKVALSDSQAEALAASLRKSTQLRGARLPDYDLKSAHALYAALLAPVQDQLSGLERLQVDAGGPLASVPFAALVDSEPTPEMLERIKTDQDYSQVPWVARKLAMANAVGPASFVRIRRIEPTKSPVSAAAFGDFTPSPRQVAEKLAKARDLPERCVEEIERALLLLDALPDTQQEVQEAAQLFGQASQSRLGDKFTDADFFADPAVRDASVILLATHGVLGLSSCFAEPALLATYSEDGDGLIEASELLDRQLSAKLVVLSACDTAGGSKADVTRTGLTDGGEALSGLARAFLYAGASSVLATQWKIDAASSGMQVKKLLQTALEPGQPLSAALGQAQKELYDSAETGHPFYWSGFVLIGDGGAQLQQGEAQQASAGQ